MKDFRDETSTDDNSFKGNDFWLVGCSIVRDWKPKLIDKFKKTRVTTLHDKNIREALEFLDTGKLSAGFVDTIYFTPLNGTIVVKSRVSPSRSIRNEPHDVWIALNKRHEIVVSWCSCIAGLAQTCNHVIAVLYKVEYATHMGYNDPACTSIPCGWNTSTTKNAQHYLNLRKDNRSKISGITTYLQII